MDSAAVARALTRIAHEVVERHRPIESLVLVGVRSRGVQLAQRIAAKLHELAGQQLPVGSIDITPYRDDLGEPPGRLESASADVPVRIDDREVLLVDDVLATGRTVRVALDVLTGLGRPRAVRVAVLVDRNDREVPIRADYVGHNVEPSERRHIRVRVRELDGADQVFLQ